MIDHGFETARTAYRPVIRGSRLVVSCGHHLASLAGMRMLDRGGNAIDAGVAATFAQLVMEYQSATLGGECPILIYSARERRTVAINGNMRAPAAATVRRYRGLGFDLIPPAGFLAAGVCATPGALIAALDRYGTLRLADVLPPAIELAANGFPVYDALRERIEKYSELFRREWPTSAAMFLPGDRVPDLGWILRNPDLAGVYERLVEAERNAAAAGRSAALRAALDRFYRGDIARRLVEFQRDTKTNHEGGPASSGLLTERDFAEFETRFEVAASVDFRGVTVHKCGPWSQGPVLLQALTLLEGFNLKSMGAETADVVHLIIECSKLAFADRERYYGDPEFVKVPLDVLLSKSYAERRRALVDLKRASLEDRPGELEGVPAGRGSVGARPWVGGTTGTRAVDAEGNIYSATPSGGWLHESPMVPGMGFALGTRLSQFWLDESHPDGIAPRKQPRTTLSPSLATRNGAPYMAFGTPGGDQQDQYNLQFFLNVVEFGMDIQDAVDRPGFQSNHFASSFYPRESHPGGVTIETSFGKDVLAELEARGHILERRRPLTQGNVTAVRIDSDGRLEASASSRGRSYAIGW